MIVKLSINILNESYDIKFLTAFILFEFSQQAVAKGKKYEYSNTATVAPIKSDHIRTLYHFYNEE